MRTPFKGARTKTIVDRRYFGLAVKNHRHRLIACDKGGTVREVVEDTELGSPNLIYRAEVYQYIGTDAFLRLCAWMGTEPSQFYLKKEVDKIEERRNKHAIYT